MRKYSTGFVLVLAAFVCIEALAEKDIEAVSFATFPLNYIDTGNPRGVPVVLVHAFPLNKDMWADQVEALKKIARVITFDIRGFGKSKSTTPYTLEYVVDDLVGLLDRLKIEKAVVCGLSMGGFVALRAIERNPDRFVGLVLADTKSEPDSDSSKLGRYKALKTIQEQGLEAFTNSFFGSALAPAPLSDYSKTLKRAQQIASSNTPLGVEMALLALTSRTDTTNGLGEIHVPTLILQGEFDTVIPLASALSLKDKIKGASFFIVPHAGHFSNFENPEEFNSRLVQFVSGLKL